jgi:hypothetical protein
LLEDPFDEARWDGFVECTHCELCLSGEGCRKVENITRGEEMDQDESSKMSNFSLFGSKDAIWGTNFTSPRSALAILRATLTRLVLV